MNPNTLPPTFKVIDGGLAQPDASLRLARRARARLARHHATEAQLVHALINLIDEAQPLRLSLEHIHGIHLRLRALQGELCAALAGHAATPDTRWCHECGDVLIPMADDYCRDCDVLRTVDSFGRFPAPSGDT